MYIYVHTCTCHGQECVLGVHYISLCINIIASGHYLYAKTMNIVWLATYATMEYGQIHNVVGSYVALRMWCSERSTMWRSGGTK